MKKILLFISAILFLISSTELHQLIRLPQLAQHYRDHKSETPGLSFVSFLKIHYIGTHPNDNDDTEDDELPFKATENLNHIDCPETNFVETTATAPLFIVDKKTTIYSAGQLIHKSYSVFRPPKYS